MTRPPQPPTSHRVNPYGLLRCCIETAQHIERRRMGLSDEGSTIQCMNCTEWMVLRDGVWQWKRD